jgi:hypothetical protein
LSELLQHESQPFPDPAPPDLSKAVHEAEFRAYVCEMRGHRFRAWLARRNASKAHRSLARQELALLAPSGSRPRSIESASGRVTRRRFGKLEAVALDLGSFGLAGGVAVDVESNGAARVEPVGPELSAVKPVAPADGDAPLNGVPATRPDSESNEPWFVPPRRQQRVSDLPGAESVLVERINAYSSSSPPRRG